MCRTNKLTTTQMKSLGTSGTNTEQIGIQAIQKADEKRKPVNDAVAGTLSNSTAQPLELSVENVEKEPFCSSLPCKNEETKPP